MVYLLQVTNSQFVMCYQLHKMGSVGVKHMNTSQQLMAHIYGIIVCVTYHSSQVKIGQLVVF